MERLTTNTRLFRNGFSLIELLVVMAMILIMVSLATVGFNSVSQSFAITSASQSVRDALILARQEATTRNRAVEVRFCRTNASAPLRHIQIVLHESDGSIRPLSRTLRLPDTVFIETDLTRSPLFTNANQAQNAPGPGFTANSNPSIPIEGSATYDVFSYFIYPDGTASLPWTANTALPSLTIRLNQNTNAAPANYATIQIDPATSRSSILRP